MVLYSTVTDPVLQARCAEDLEHLSQGESAHLDVNDSSPKNQSLIVIYTILAVVAASAVGLHRFLPLRYKMYDLMFAKAHYIEDKMAIRSLESRLGASFNFALLVVTLGIVVMVLNKPNTAEADASAVPIETSNEILKEGFGRIHLHAKTFAHNSGAGKIPALESRLEEFIQECIAHQHY